MAVKAFDILRKRQKTVIAVLAVLSMFLFVIGDACVGARSGGGASFGYTVRRWFGGAEEESLLELSHKRHMAFQFLRVVRLRGQELWEQRQRQSQQLNRESQVKVESEAEATICARLYYVFNFPNPQTGRASVFAMPSRELPSNDSVEGLLEFRSLLQEANRLGIVVSPKRLREDLLKSCYGMVTDADIPGILRAAQIGVDSDTLLRYAADEARVLIARAAIEGAGRRGASGGQVVKATPLDLWNEYRVINTRLPDVQFLEVDVERFVALVKEEPTEQELEAFFRQYRHQDPPPRQAAAAQQGPDPHPEQPGFRVPPRYMLDFVYVDLRKDKDAATGLWKAGPRNHYEKVVQVESVLPGLFALTPAVLPLGGGPALFADLASPTWSLDESLNLYEQEKYTTYGRSDLRLVPLVAKRKPRADAISVATGPLPTDRGAVLGFTYYESFAPLLGPPPLSRTPMLFDVPQFARDEQKLGRESLGALLHVFGVASLAADAPAVSVLARAYVADALHGYMSGRDFRSRFAEGMTPLPDFGWDAIDVESANAAQYMGGAAGLMGGLPLTSVVCIAYPSPQAVGPGHPRYGEVKALEAAHAVSLSLLGNGTPIAHAGAVVPLPALVAEVRRAKPFSEVADKVREEWTDREVRKLADYDLRQFQDKLAEYGKLYRQAHADWQKKRRGTFEPPRFGEAKETFAEFALRYAKERDWLFASTGELRSETQFLEEGASTPLGTFIKPLFLRLQVVPSREPEKPKETATAAERAKYEQELERWKKDQERDLTNALIGPTLRFNPKHDFKNRSIPPVLREPYEVFMGRWLVDRFDREHRGDFPHPPLGRDEFLLSWKSQEAEPFTPNTVSDYPLTARDKQRGHHPVVHAWKLEKARTLAEQHAKDFVKKFEGEFKKSGNVGDALRPLIDDPTFKNDHKFGKLVNAATVARYESSTTGTGGAAYREATPPFLDEPPADFFDMVYQKLNRPGDTVILFNRLKSRCYALVQEKERTYPTLEEFRSKVMGSEHQPTVNGQPLSAYVLANKSREYDQAWSKFLRDSVGLDAESIKRLEEAIRSRRESGFGE